jgi:H+/gluconate symporter-like permease
MIFGLPAILGLIPLIIYIVLALRGKNIAYVVLLCTVIGAIMTGQTPITFGSDLYAALGSFMALVGFIIIMGAGLGEVLTKTGVANAIVKFIIVKSGVKTQKQVTIAVMFASCLLVALLGTLAGANAIIAPIVIPVVASLGITPSTLSVLMHGAGATGLFLGPFTPPVVTYTTLAGVSYGQYLINAGIPISIVVWICTFISARKTQKQTEGHESYSNEDMAAKNSGEITPKVKKATAVFIISMVVLIVYGILAKGGAAYALTVMLVTTFVTGFVGGLSAEQIIESLLAGGSRMYKMFFMFVLYDPFMNYITTSGAFDAIADLMSPIMGTVGAVGFMVASTLIGIFGVAGAAVAQAKVMDDMFKVFLTTLNIPPALWALVLLVGSQITSFAYPTGDMVGQMGLARSTSLKPMLKNGVLITISTIIYVTVRGIIYQLAGI